MQYSSEVESMAPHTQMVYEKLAKQSVMSQKELLEETRLPFRVVRDGLSTLRGADLVTEHIYSHGRRRVYELTVSSDQQPTQPETANV